MKKVLFAMTALAAAVATASIQSANVVGYMNKGGLDADFNYVGASFVPVNGDKANMSLGDLTASDDFIFSTIQFWTNGGANKRVTVNEFVNVKANYVYWPADCGQEGEVAGWYLEDDTNAKYPQNEVEILAGGGFIVARDGTEPNVQISIPSAL